MIITITKEQAVDMLMADKYANWSYEGARALVEHIESCERHFGEHYMLDVVQLRTKCTEYANLEEACRDLGVSETELRNSTNVIEFDGGIIIEQI